MESKFDGNQHNVDGSGGSQSSGSRLLPEMRGWIGVEHLHRYALAQTLVSGKAVLDLACGTGYGTKMLSENAASVVGVDLDQRNVDEAAEKYRSPNIRFVQGDGRALPFGDNLFDMVVSFETIEHIVEQEQFIRELKRVMKPDGLLYMSTPNAGVYRRRLSPNPWHVKELTHSEFVDLLSRFFQSTQSSLQRVWSGSVVLPHSSCPNSEGFTSFVGSFDSVRAHAGLVDPVYLVAMATDATAFPKLPWGCFASPENFDPSNFELRQEERVAMERLQLELADMRRSTSWRITAPIRWLRNLTK